ncbi:MAG: Ig-like domain-containing protein, partial [Lachnospiraceae bacterium]|nr:Ig-like domain-containing protein [Lachnospiraceae bacterium]
MAGVEIKTKIMGYCEVKFDEDGQLVLLEGGAIASLSGSGEITYPIKSLMNLVYVKAGLKLTSEGKLEIYLDDFDIDWAVVMDLKTTLTIAAGVGGDNAHLEVGAEGELEGKLTLPWEDIENSLEINASAKLYFEAKAFFLKWDKEKTLVEEPIWPKENSGGGFRSSLQAASISEDTEDDYWEMIDRDYLTSAYSRRTTVATIEQETTYPEGTPEMVKLSDGTLLAVWIKDDGSKSDENRTTLYYAVNDGSGWSTPTAVCETGRGDFYPSLIVNDDTEYLVWINIDHELDSDFTSTELMKSTDIYYAEFVDGSFTEPVLVTETGNDIMELNAKVIADGTKSTVIWVENSENDPYLSSGTNAIYAKTYEDGDWGETVCVADNLNAISSIDAAYLDGVLNIAYIMDLDGSTDTDDDDEVFLYTDGATSRVTSDSKSDENVHFSDDMLYWSSNGEIMQMQVGSLRRTVSTGLAGASGFEILENGEEKAIIILVADGFKNELYLARAEGDGFADPIPATDFGLHINDYAAVLQDDGSVTAMIFETEVYEEWEDSPYGSTALRVYDVLEAANLTLEDFYIDEEDVEPNATVTAEMTLYNESSTDLSTVTVSLSDGSDILLNEENVFCIIGAGEEGTVSVDVMLGDDVSMKTLTATVTPVDYEDSDTSDNTLEQEIGYGDLALEIENATVTVSEDGSAVIEGVLSNSGYAEQTGVTIQLLEGGESGEVIYTGTYDAVAVGAEYNFSIPIASDNLNFDNAYDGVYFQLVCSSESEERRYDNNSEIIVVYPIPVTGIADVPEAMTLTVKGQGQLTATVVPSTAANNAIYYTTDNSEVAIVDENGLITAVEEGTATITAITADGGYAESCVVTVTAAETEDTVYGLDTIALLLQKGESGSLGIIDQNGDASTEEVSAVWTSSDETVATVSEDGAVTAIAAGTATIYVCINGTFYDACIVNVTDTELQAIIMSSDTLTLTEGESDTLSVTCIPASLAADLTLTWSSSDEAVATVSEDGTVAAIAAGTATITALTDNGKAAECKVKVEAIPRYTVTFDSDLGDEEQEISDIPEGTTIELPDEPERTGYYFSGWFTEKNGQGTRFTSTTPVTGSLTVYANWTLGQYYEGFEIEDIPAQTYTGSAIKPEPVVYDGGTLLVKNQDYTLSYKNNTKAGTGQVIVKGKGNYTRTMTVEFEIVKKDISDASAVTATSADKATTAAVTDTDGNLLTKWYSYPTVKYGKLTLKRGTDYTVDG